MTRHDDALEQMRSANPLVGIGDIDADELGLSRSHFEERRLAMTTRTPTQRDRTRTAWSRRPALIAASAFVLVVALIGTGTFMLRGSEADTPATDASVAVVTTPTVTTIPKESAVVAPEESAEPAEQEPTIEFGVRVLSDVPEYGTNLVLGADGLPMFLSTTRSGDEYPGTARLFRCTDIACDDLTIEALDYEPGSGWALVSAGVFDAFVAGPSGDVYIILESPDAMQSIGRYDGDLVEPLPILSNWPAYQPPAGSADPTPHMPLPSAFDDQGYPAFVTFHGAFPATVNLLVCNDPLCSDFIEVEFDSATFHDGFPEVSIEGNTAQVIYSTAEPIEPLHSEEIGMTETVSEIKVATISDLYGSPTVAVEILDVDPRVTGEFDPQMRGISAHVEEVYDPDEYAAYLEAQAAFDAAVAAAADEQGRTYPEDVDIESPTEPEPLGTNIVVTRCSDGACTSTERTTIAAFEVPWWYLGSLELEVSPDGTVLVAIASVGEYAEPGLSLYVFPNGEFGPGVEPIAGHAVVGWDAR